MNLYALTETTITLSELLETLTDESAVQTLADSLAVTDAQLESKCEGYAKLIRSLEAEAEACKNEARHFQDRAKSATNKADWLKKALKVSMDARGITEQRAGLFKLAIQKNGGVAPIQWEPFAEPAKGPAEYVKVETIYNWDTEKVRQDLNDGKILDFATLGERGTRLVIK